MASSHSDTKKASVGAATPTYLKYQKKATAWANPSMKLKPSELMSQTLLEVVAEDYPLIVEFVNMKDNTSQIHSVVDIDEPLFQPSPSVMIFEDYAPFAVHEKKLFFRNSDKVARRIKILQPESPFFEISAPRSVNGEPLKQSKIASGMEVCFVVRFKPQEVRDYSYDFVCVTEREKFIVPVRCVGNRPRVDFPDEIDFGACPMKSNVRKTFVVQNSGNAVANFMMKSSSSSVSCSKELMTIEPNASKLLEMFFNPTSGDLIRAEVHIEFVKGPSCYMSVTGSGKNVEVALSTPSLTLEPAFISLSSQKTLKVKNHSNVAIDFSWKSFANVAEETNERDRLHGELDRMEAMEEVQLFREIQDGQFGEPSDQDTYDATRTNTANISFEAKAALGALSRKYRNLHTALDSDKLNFVDEIFEILPISGTVWPKSDVEITVNFRPDTAALFSCLAFMEVSGREDRLPLTLTGSGIGPHCVLSFDVFDMGDVSVNSEQNYSVTLTNKGDIPAVWSIIPSTSRYGNKFEFFPNEGTLDVNNSQVIKIKVLSDVLGDFFETFQFALQGNEDVLQCSFKGCFVGPTFHFDSASINYGIVSFDCLSSSTIVLVNTSSINFDFRFSVPEDGTYLKKEFDISPAEGSIVPGQSIEIAVEFIPASVKSYEYSLVMDILGVGSGLARLPILAECIVSTIRLAHKEVKFGDCFVRYPYQQDLVVTNMSDVVHTKFEVMPQPQYTKSAATYTSSPTIGVVEPGGTMSVTFTLKPEKLGNFKVPVLFRVLGSQEPPMQATLVFSSVGPKVLCDQAEIKWGNIECLVDQKRPLRITNASLIPASINLFLKFARSKFEVSDEEIHLQPNEYKDIVVSANLDDTVVYKDELHIAVHEGDGLMIPLNAKGIGTTIHCDSDISCIDFGVQLTNMVFERKITLENNGRRQQQLKWINVTNVEENNERLNKAKKIGKDNPTARLPKNLMPVEPVFTVFPTEITLRPRTATSFVFKGSSAAAALLSENMVLESRVGSDRTMKPIINTVVKAEVVPPLLETSRAVVDFEYSWSRGHEPSMQKDEITLTNKTAVPLSFVFRTEIPFNLSHWECTLQPDESTDLVVEFDPNYRGDRTSHTIDNAITISYRGHPQKDSIALKAFVKFPNLEFDREAVNFGCVLNETSKTVRVHARNWSDIDAAFKWTFFETVPAKGAPKKSSSAGVSSLPSAQIFDIMPISGVLAAGDSCDMEFVMFGHQNSKFSGQVICEIEGGPEYKLPLTGEASVVSYLLDRTVLDFGKVLFSEKKDEEFILTNQGKVPFNFEFDLSQLTSPGIIEAIPQSGKVNAGEKVKLILRFQPRIPSTFRESVFLSVAHFDPAEIVCHCVGIFPNTVVTLPRYKKVGPFGEADDVDAKWGEFTSLASSFVPSLEDLIKEEVTGVSATRTLDRMISSSLAMTSAMAPVYYSQDLNRTESAPVSTEDDLKSVGSIGSISSLKKKRAKEKSQIMTELEMNRLVFCKLYPEKLEKITATRREEAGSRREAQGAPSSRPGTSKSNANPDSPVGVSEVVVGTYLCDFGNVVCGTSRKKVFKVVNASNTGPLSWVFDTNVINARGYSIEPQKVEKLPEGASIDFTVKFLARQKSKLGRLSCLLPISVKGAPVVNIMLTSNVCMPDLELSAESLDFGQILLGRSKQMFLQLKNIAPVSTSWSVKAGTFDSRFKLSEYSGTIRAQGKQMIYVEFMPTDGRKVKTDISLKVDLNGKGKILSLVGEGLPTPIRFEPTRVDLGPILPYSAEGASSVITVFNDGENPVEFFSLDFDCAYKDEEALLSAAPSLFDADNIFRTDLRHPGEGLPASLVSQCIKAKNAASGDESVEDSVLQSPQYKLAPVRTAPAPRDSNLQQDIVFCGPPLVGVSSIARSMSKKLQLVSRSMDEILADIAQTDCDSGLVARRIMSKLNDEERAQIEKSSAELLEKSNTSIAEASEKFKNDKKNKGKEPPPEVLETPEAVAYKEFVNNGVLNLGNIAQMITFRLSWEDAGYGIIIDGLDSSYCDSYTLLEGLQAALPHVLVCNVMLSGGEEAYTARLASLFANKSAERMVLRASLAGVNLDRHMEKEGDADVPLDLSMRPELTSEMIPTGNELWFDVHKGSIIVYSEDEIKALDARSKDLYLKQLSHLQWTQLDEIEYIISRISQLWTIDNGLKPATLTVGDPEESNVENAPENDSSVDKAVTVLRTRKPMHFDEYLNKFIPAIIAAFPEVKAKDVVIGKIGSRDVADPDEILSQSGGVVINDTSNLGDRGYCLVDLDADDNEEISASTAFALLPAPKVSPPDVNKIPDAIQYQLIRKPLQRVERKAIKYFTILPFMEVPGPTELVEKKEEEAVKAPPAKDSKAKKGSQDAVVAVAETASVAEKNPTRWVIQPFSSLKFSVRFKSTIEGRAESTLGFEVVGYQNLSSVHVSGQCEVPKVNGDSRNVFMRRVKAVAPGAPPPQHRFVMNEDFFSFGPLLSFKKPEWRLAPPDNPTEQQLATFNLVNNTNQDIVRISNNGKYKCKAELGFTGAANPDLAGIFMVEPSVLELEEGETKDAKIWAFPTALQEYKDSLVVCISDNPIPLTFEMRCTGVEPNVEFSGPWTETFAAADAELAELRAQPKPDAKKVKEMETRVAAMKEAMILDFDRILVSRSETRSFQMKNTSLLPVAFAISLDSFKDSTCVEISPISGVIPVGGSTTITVSYTSPEALVTSGTFSLRYSDNENGLDSNASIFPNRVKTSTFRVNAEAYEIKAVSLTSAGQDEGGDAMDLGTVRVGDFITGTIKVANRGKYQIGYNFNVRRPQLAAMLKIEPDCGNIEAGASCDVSITFCCPESEVNLKDNKDIRVQINEPKTGEQIEEFPIMFTVSAKYNKFRMQPAKGISFSAVRYDAEIQQKRVEIRNEGLFEFAYVICPVSHEVDELDTLDGGALACYAFGTPPARRKGELGEDYLNRIAASSGAAAGGGKGKAAPKKDPPVKGKKDVERVDTGKPSPKDPDNLTLPIPPEDPLTLGAFTVFPRVGFVQPGECIGVDIKFDPAGCETSRERLRFCITGIDPKALPSTLAKSFEVVGESCLPAIVTDEIHSIFEEQQIVHSLADVTLPSKAGSGSDSSGGGKIEKLAVGKVVYAEVENLLAFGPVMCSSGVGKGTVERIRISNPTKIDCRVNFKIVNGDEPTGDTGKDPKGKDAKGTKSKKPATDAVAEEKTTGAFTLQPESWDIPPHEYRIVNLYFNPTEIKSYRGKFKAEVDEGNTTIVKNKQAISGKKLEFSLAGSGTIPCIAIDHPIERGTDGNLCVDFHRVHVNKTCKRKIVIRNSGVMPATCLFDMTSSNLKDFAFSLSGCSLTLGPGEMQELMVIFAPKTLDGEGDSGERAAEIKISVLHNVFDSYLLKLSGLTYSCDAIVEVRNLEARQSRLANLGVVDLNNDPSDFNGDELWFDDINLMGAGSFESVQTFSLRSRSNKTQKFQLSCDPSVDSKLFSFSPSAGHIAPDAVREISVTFSTEVPIQLDAAKIYTELATIQYTDVEPENEDAEANDDALRGIWDNSMQVIRPGTEEDTAKIQAYETLLNEYEAAKAEADKAKNKKGVKPLGPPPEPCSLSIVSTLADGSFMIKEVVREPKHEVIADIPKQTLTVLAKAAADNAKYSCAALQGPINFHPTFLFQSCTHKFSFKNESNISMPIRWFFEDAKRKSTTRGSVSRGSTARIAQQVPCPFTILPEECTIAPNAEHHFTLKFSPSEVDNFAYFLRAETIPCVGPKLSAGDETKTDEPSMLRTLVRGDAKRPICHFDITESRDYLSRRQPNLKNENGLNSPIETSDIRVVEVESCGLRSRNTFRFHILNPTNDSYEFLWEAVGDPSPAWRCVLSSGVLFGGKQAEMVFEYLPEETAVAETFFKFKLPSIGLEQLFLFAGIVNEPKVAFTVSRIDFSNCMLGGEGGSEIIYIENEDHLPFNFAFDKTSLMNLDGPNGPILDIVPKAGIVAPHSKCAIEFLFKPQEEVLYNFNIFCEVKRKPLKLSLNVKGEGYAVHPIIQLEQTILSGKDAGSRFMMLRPAPAVNYADFGAVQVLDSISKTMTVTNSGKYNFDYLWETEDVDRAGGMLSLSGGKMGGTLLKGEEATYSITFAPTREFVLDGASMKFTVAGKYTYTIVARGSGVKPALRFSFLHHDFGDCFVTSPGGAPVIEEQVLQIVNHDPVGNIAVECTFQRTRALWAECQPTVLEPGGILNVPLRFAPRDAKDYAFVIPFVINGTGKVNVQIVGRGINPRLDLANASQRRVHFGVADVGTEVRRTVALANRSKKAIEVQLLEDGQYGGGVLLDNCVSFFPTSSFVIAPKQTSNVQLTFSPNHRVSMFTEDLLVRYAGVTRKLLTVSGKAQGAEVTLDTDSLPFGTVVLASEKSKKLSLENTGDLAISFQWIDSTFGPHISISPMSGKLQPGNDMVFNVTFRPKFLDDDIRQEGITLSIPGMSPLLLTISGMCVAQPSENIKLLQFDGIVRSAEEKKIPLSNPTDKDWFVSPSLDGIHWKIPHEIKIPAKGSADLVVTYFPFHMSPKPPKEPTEGEPDTALLGKLFLAFPDGTAHLYKLRGYAAPPKSSGVLTTETSAKKASIIPVRLVNWLPEIQKFKVAVSITEQPTPATSFVVANAVDIGPNGEKDFQIRFQSYVEGTTKATITFTNPSNGEYFFYDIVAKTTPAQVLETISIESSARQTARYLIGIENPLGGDVPITMGMPGKPDDWWTCDSKVIRLNQLVPLSGHAEGSYEIEYRPLAPTKHPQEVTLTIFTKELGVFIYKLSLTASPPPSRQRLVFEVPLGTIQTEVFNFRCYNNTAVTFNCSVEHPNFFTVDKVYNAAAASSWEGTENKLEIQFEPTELGEHRDVLTMTSSDGGEYICDLIGVCIPPVPAGPFMINKGASIDIPFRNCFTTNCEWSFTIDSPCFRVVNGSSSVPAKSAGSCTILFEPLPEVVEENPGGAVIPAKLFINCKTNPSIPPWIFYLKGKFEAGAVAVAAGVAAGGKKK